MLLIFLDRKWFITTRLSIGFLISLLTYPRYSHNWMNPEYVLFTWWYWGKISNNLSEMVWNTWTWCIIMEFFVTWTCIKCTLFVTGTKISTFSAKVTANILLYINNYMMELILGLLHRKFHVNDVRLFAVNDALMSLHSLDTFFNMRLIRNSKCFVK